MQRNVLRLLPRLIMLDWTVRLDALVGLEAVDSLCEGKLGKHVFDCEDAEIKCVSIFCRTQVPHLLNGSLQNLRHRGLPL